MTIPADYNLLVECLKRISDALKGVEYYITFGTLLGFVREGSLIKGDNDIDIHINREDVSFVLDKINRQDWFNIGTRMTNYISLRPEGPARVDLIHYDIHEDHIIDCFTFSPTYDFHDKFD